MNVLRHILKVTKKCVKTSLSLSLAHFPYIDMPMIRNQHVPYIIIYSGTHINMSA